MASALSYCGLDRTTPTGGTTRVVGGAPPPKKDKPVVQYSSATVLAAQKMSKMGKSTTKMESSPPAARAAAVLGGTGTVVLMMVTGRDVVDLVVVEVARVVLVLRSQGSVLHGRYRCSGGHGAPPTSGNCTIALVSNRSPLPHGAEHRHSGGSKPAA